MIRVLVVEDDKETAAYIVKGLTECGHIADHAEDGREGLLMADSTDYQVIVADRMLPKVDGVTMTRTLRGSGNRTPILMLSALGDVDDRVVGLKAGADDYLVKPFAFSELQARIEALVRRAEPESPDTVLKVADLEMDLLKTRSASQRRENRLAAARIQAVGVFDAPQWSGRHPHHAAGEGVGTIILIHKPT